MVVEVNMAEEVNMVEEVNMAGVNMVEVNMAAEAVVSLYSLCRCLNLIGPFNAVLELCHQVVLPTGAVSPGLPLPGIPAQHLQYAPQDLADHVVGVSLPHPLLKDPVPDPFLAQLLVLEEEGLKCQELLVHLLVETADGEEAILDGLVWHGHFDGVIYHHHY